MLDCLHCGAPTTNGLALCELSMRKATTDLVFIGVYYRNLARWRPGRAGSRPVPGSRVLWDGSISGNGDRIERALDEATTALTTWARALVDDRPHFARPLTFADAVLCDDLADEMAEALNDEPATKIAWLCTGLGEHLTSISTLDWCGELVRQLGSLEEQLRGITEKSIPGWYAGACNVCGTATHVVPGLTWVTCTSCGTTTYARDHLDVVLSEARDWVARPMRLAEAIVALIDTEASARRLFERIHKWGQRGRIEAVRRTRINDFGSEVECGPKSYRLGDVLNVLLNEGATRVDDERIGA